MGYDQVVSRRGLTIPNRDLARETDHYSNQWQVTQKTPEEVQAYLRETYGDAVAQVRETDKKQRPRFVYTDGLNYATYTTLKSEGLSDQRIADMYGITRSALVGRRKNWALNLQSR
jgi:hypothetical protein